MCRPRGTSTTLLSAIRFARAVGQVAFRQGYLPLRRPWWSWGQARPERCRLARPSQPWPPNSGCPPPEGRQHPVLLPEWEPATATRVASSTVGAVFQRRQREDCHPAGAPPACPAPPSSRGVMSASGSSATDPTRPTWPKAILVEPASLCESSTIRFVATCILAQHISASRAP